MIAVKSIMDFFVIIGFGAERAGGFLMSPLGWSQTLTRGKRLPFNFFSFILAFFRCGKDSDQEITMLTFHLIAAAGAGAVKANRTHAMLMLLGH